MTAPVLDLRFESCVRALSVWTSCTKCVEACPESAISDDGVHKSIVVDLDRCTDCGLCGAACPTDAFAQVYDVDRFVDTAGARLRCGDGVPCIAAIATEDLITLMLRHGELTLVDGVCGHGGHHAAAATRVAEANAFLKGTGLHGVARLERGTQEHVADEAQEQPALPDRRRLFLGGATRPVRGKLTMPGRLDKDNLQYTQDRRWRFLARLPDTARAVEPTVDADTLSFASSKVLHADRCTLCTVCVRICPTGALTSGRTFRDLRFDASLCVKCGLCHEVCVTDAITLGPETSLVDFLAQKPVVLGKIKARKCVECDMAYNAAVHTNGLCPRCASLEEEAIALSTVSQAKARGST